LQTASPSALHPVFEALTRSIQDAPRIVRQAQIDGYVKALRLHDWSHEASDDHNVWRAGRAQLKHLEQLQRELDPDFAIWNVNAPAAYRRSA
jgi:broad specificity polyphosphatase/5'/3'-nucleotidase SurE